MAHGQENLDVSVYGSGFWKQLGRYGNPVEAMGTYLDSFKGAKKIAMISGGPRLLAVISAIPGIEEVLMYDIFPGSLEATESYIKEPDKYLSEYAILREEMAFLDKKNLKPRLDKSLIKLCLRDEIAPSGDFESGDYDGAMAEEVALHPPPEHLGEHTLPVLLDDAQQLLRKGGKFIFSSYPGLVGGNVIDDSLLDHFKRLVKFSRMDGKGVCDDDKWIRIDRVAKYLKNISTGLYDAKKERFWLEELSRIRMYSYGEVSELAGDRFKIAGWRNIPGGMFPFARRSYYILDNSGKNKS